MAKTTNPIGNLCDTCCSLCHPKNIKYGKQDRNGLRKIIQCDNYEYNESREELELEPFLSYSIFGNEGNLKL